MSASCLNGQGEPIRVGGRAFNIALSMRLGEKKVAQARDVSVRSGMT